MTKNNFVEVDFTEQGKKKINKDIYKKAIKKAIERTTIKANSRCIEESPIALTGNLRGGHSFKIKGDNEGVIRNSEPYHNWIIWGHGGRNTNPPYPAGHKYKIYQDGRVYEFTSKGIPNNYPQRVAQELTNEKYILRCFLEELKESGVEL